MDPSNDWFATGSGDRTIKVYMAVIVVKMMDYVCVCVLFSCGSWLVGG